MTIQKVAILFCQPKTDVCKILFAFVFTEDRESLKFKLSGAKDYEILAEPTEASADNLGSWGHEFVRSLAGEIGQEYNQRVIDGADPDSDEAFEDLLKFVNVIVPFHLTHNAEAEAVDLLIEVQRLKYLLKLDSIDDKNYRRICLYLIKTASFMSDPDDLVVRKVFSKCSCRRSPYTKSSNSLFLSNSIQLTGNARNRIRDLSQTGTIS